MSDIAQDLGGVVLLPCPCCGWQPPFDDADSMLDFLYPTGTWWREERTWVPSQHTGQRFRTYHKHKDRKDGDKACYGMHCTQNMGGCGVRIVRDSREEAIAAWNTRTHSAEIAGALRDAERLNWLDANGGAVRRKDNARRNLIIWSAVYAPSHKTIRGAIDSAMQQGGGGG